MHSTRVLAQNLPDTPKADVCECGIQRRRSCPRLAPGAEHPLCWRSGGQDARVLFEVVDQVDRIAGESEDPLNAFAHQRLVRLPVAVEPPARGQACPAAGAVGSGGERPIDTVNSLTFISLFFVHAFAARALGAIHQDRRAVWHGRLHGMSQHAEQETSIRIHRIAVQPVAPKGQVVTACPFQLDLHFLRTPGGRHIAWLQRSPNAAGFRDEAGGKARLVEAFFPESHHEAFNSRWDEGIYVGRSDLALRRFFLPSRRRGPVAPRSDIRLEIKGFAEPSDPFDRRNPASLQ